MVFLFAEPAEFHENRGEAIMKPIEEVLESLANLEKETDRIIEEAHTKASRIKAEAAIEIEKLEEEYEKKFIRERDKLLEEAKKEAEEKARFLKDQKEKEIENLLNQARQKIATVTEKYYQILVKAEWL